MLSFSKCNFRKEVETLGLSNGCRKVFLNFLESFFVKVKNGCRIKRPSISTETFEKLIERIGSSFILDGKKYRLVKRGGKLSIKDLGIKKKEKKKVKTVVVETTSEEVFVFSSDGSCMKETKTESIVNFSGEIMFCQMGKRLKYRMRQGGLFIGEFFSRGKIKAVREK